MSTLRHKIALFVLAATLSAVAGSLHNPPMFCDARTGQCSECVNDGVENGTNGVETIERASTQGAPYGATSVMRTITTWTPATLPGPEAGLIASIRHENGTIDRYSYTLGSGSWIETVTHNHELSPINIIMRTTRDVRTWNARGDLLETHTDLLTSTDIWTPIERTSYTYDLEGHILSTTGTSGILEFNTYGIDNGLHWKQAVFGDKLQSACHTKECYNMLGQIIREEKSGANGSVLSRDFIYDGFGTIERVESNYLPIREISYDPIEKSVVIKDSVGAEWRERCQTRRFY